MSMRARKSLSHLICLLVKKKQKRRERERESFTKMAMNLVADVASPGEGTMVVWDPESKREIRTSGSPEEVFRSGDGGVRVLMHPLFVNSYVVFVAPRSLLVVD